MQTSPLTLKSAKQRFIALFTCLVFCSTPVLAGHHEHHNHEHDHEHQSNHHEDYHGHHDDHDDTHNNHDHRGHKQTAHEHGVAKMQLTIVKQDVFIEVNSPLYNVVGFEHFPKTDEQKQQLVQQLQIIEKTPLITLNEKAHCTLEAQKASNPFKDANSQAKHSDLHSDLHFEYQFHCHHPEAVTQVSADKLFKAWPNLKSLRVEWIHNQHQSAATLNPAQTLIKLH